MNTVVVIEVRRGRDGKCYLAKPLAGEQRARARNLAHDLVCRQHLSIRQAQRALAGQYGLRRSIGIIARDLRDFECQWCPRMPDG